MRLMMVKKRLVDGSECRKCQAATALLQSRGVWDRVDEIVWAVENDPSSVGMVLSARYAIDNAPFFIVRDEAGEVVYTSVLQLLRDRLDRLVTAVEQAQSIDVEDLGI
jgi:hypothetical protein